MKMITVSDAGFAAFGQVMPGFDAEAVRQALLALPMPDAGFVYQPREDSLHALTQYLPWLARLFADMPCQMGYCLGNNKDSSILARHGGSTFVWGLSDFDLLLSSRYQGPAGAVRCRIPAETLTEIFGDTLRSAPLGQGLRILVLQPYATNTEYSAESLGGGQLTARNTWTYDTGAQGKGA